MRIVRNVTGTGMRACPCGSWIDHWHGFSEVPDGTTPYCAALKCAGESVRIVGAHVVFLDEADRVEWIVPLCDACNRVKGVFTIRNAPRALANKRRTCEQEIEEHYRSSR